MTDMIPQAAGKRREAAGARERGSAPFFFWWGLLVALLGLSHTAPAEGLQAEIDLRYEAAERMIAGGKSNDRLGTVMAVGDFDGDGWEDLALGAPHANDPRGGDRNGLAYVLFGPISPSTEPYDLLAFDELPGGEAVRLGGADEEDWLGFSLTLGDLNGDQVDDLVVGVPLADGPENQDDWRGEVLVFWGGPAWRTTSQIEPASADRVLYGEDFFDRLGIGVAVGDLDGDGVGDLVASAPFGQENEGKLANRVYLFFGPDLERSRVIENLDFHNYSSGNNHNLAVGDVNGDAVDDLLVGVPRGDEFASEGGAGMVYGLFGGGRLSAATEPLDFFEREQFQLLFAAKESYDYLGQAVAVAEAGPQGPPWVAIGAPGADYRQRGWDQSGVVYLIAGGAGLATGTDWILPGTAGLAIYGGDDFYKVGVSLAFGDVDGDTLPDLLIGAPFAEGPPRHEDHRVGRVYCLYGTTLQAATETLNLREDFDLVIFGNDSDDEFGYALAAGRVLADATPGQGDNIVASAWTADGIRGRGLIDAGEVYLFADRAAAPVTTSGDLNGDGRVDFRDALLLSLPAHRLPAKTGASDVAAPHTPLLLFLEEWKSR